MDPGEKVELQRRPERTPLDAVEPGIRENEGQLVHIKPPRRRIWGSMKFMLVCLTTISVSIALKTMTFMWEEKLDPLDYRARTSRLLSRTPLIDGHNDLPFLVRLQLNNQIYENNLPFGQGQLFPFFGIEKGETDVMRRPRIAYRPQAHERGQGWRTILVHFC